MSANSKIKSIQSKIDDKNIIGVLDTALTNVAFLEQDEVDISQLAWDRDIDENERIVIMTEEDYDEYCDVIHSAQSLLKEIKDMQKENNNE